ncbi:MAG TPA: histidinol-phosphate transaminase [Rhodospirillales bacterium]|nr:histidinol-phosphate transaminase [Rhodospirillales bacterium]
MILPVPRPGILDIAPYVGGESSVPGLNRIIKLASNESALGPSPRAMDAFREAAAALHRYPDGGCTALRRALGQHFDLDPARIVCGAGSDELLGLLARAYVGPGEETLYTEHGFLIYPIATRAAGATPCAVPERALTADVDALLAAVTPATRIVFLANPNNPTGTYLPAEEMRRLREGLPPGVLLVIDAAYAEYVDARDYSAGFELADSFGSVVVTRTFSKIYGLGGARLGWAYCPDAVADVLNRLRMPFNVSSAAQAAGIAALADEGAIEAAKEHNRRWRTWTHDAIAGLGLAVGESHCNFVLVRFPADGGLDAASADAYLKSRGIIARRVVAYGLPDCLRITIGLEAEMRACVAALADFLESRG